MLDLDNFKIEGPYAWVIRSDVSFVTGLVYVAVVFAYKQWFEPPPPPPGQKPPKRKVPGWVKPVAIVHNFFLAAVSLAMFLGMLTSYLEVCEKIGTDNCLDLHRTGKEYINIWQGKTGFWMWLFDASKYYELFDTVLMMAKGYQLIVLHWWHHASVPFLCSIHAFDRTSTAWTGSCFNCFVHVIMYSYYGLSAAGISVPGKNLVTGLQIAQFCIVLSHLTWVWARHDFWDFPWTISTGYTIYLSYLLFFIKFYYDSYVTKSDDAGTTKTKTNGHTNGVTNGVHTGKTSQKKKSKKAD